MLTEKQTEQILQKLTIPEDRHFTTEEYNWLLESDSFDNPFSTKKKLPSKAKLALRPLSYSLKTLYNYEIKMPKDTQFSRPGVVLPTNVFNPTLQHGPFTYTDFGHATRMITSGDIAKSDLISAQKQDPILGKIFCLKTLPKPFIFIEGILYYHKRNHYKLALPTSFLEAIIHS